MDLQRYGRGPDGFPYILTALPNGYWTPWHLADQQIRRLEARVEELQSEVGRLRDNTDSNQLRQLVSDLVKRDAHRFRKLLMQDKHWLGVFRCDPDGAPSDSLSHVELKTLLDAMDGPELDF